MSVRVMNKGVVDVHGLSCVSMIESPSPAAVVIVTGKEEIRREEKKVNKFSIYSSSTTTSSSIGKNSDLSTGEKENSSDTVTDHEVQSPYKGGPLNAMEDLEEVLPIRRGISRFYNGKSKSFASLADTTSSTTSMKEIAKPENPYMKRRRNLLATSCLAWDKNNRSSSSSFLKKSNGGGVSKRMVTTTANRTTTTTTTALAALAFVTMNGTGKCIAECLNTNFKASPSSSHRTSAALKNPHHNFGPWRSYSLVDLQQCISVTAVPRTPLNVKPSHT